MTSSRGVTSTMWTGSSPPTSWRTAREWLRWYLSAFSDRGWDVHDVISEGDRAVARYSGWATYKGGLLDIPSTRQRVIETVILILRVRDGPVRELWSKMSDLQLVMQLGAFPEWNR